MNSMLKLSFAIYVANIVFMLACGSVFEFRNEFLTIHSDVIQTDWQNVNPLAQILYLGMMRTEGAGFLATATALAFLLCFPFRNHEKWSFWAMTIIGVVEYFPTVVANYHVSSVTEASPPWLVMLSFSLSLFVALSLAIVGHDQIKTE